MDNNNVHGMMYRNPQNPGVADPNSFFSHHSMDNSNKNVNKDVYPMNECNDQNDDGYETGVSDMMSLKYKHHPSFTTLPPSSPFSSISSISSTTPTSFATSQQQQSPIYNIGNNSSYHYHLQQQQYQQNNPMLSSSEGGSQTSPYNHHLPNNSMYGNQHNDPYNFAAHEYQQMNSHFSEVNNDGKIMMSLDAENAKFNQQQQSQKFFNENGTKESHGEFYSNIINEKGVMDLGGSMKNETVKKRGRKRKNDEDNNDPTEKPKGRRKHDKFNGMSELEVSQRFLPDQITYNLDIVIIGINPGLFAAYKGHYFAGPGNHFWKCMYLSELTQTQMTAEEDYRLLERGIGFTNIVQRPTKGSADLTRKEIKDGCITLLEKLQKFQPKVAVFNGKLIYEVFSGKKDFYFGKQAELVEGTNTHIWVMPSSSARCAQLPRAADKVPFYAALRKFKDYLNGLVPEYVESDYVFTDPKYNQLTSPSPEIETMNQDGCFDENQSNLKRKKRGRPKKKNFEDESNDCKQTKELDGEMSDDKQNGSKKKRGRPKKSNDGESPVKAAKKSKKNAGNLSEQNLNPQSERSSISPMMESSSSFSNSLSSSHQQQPVPVQAQPQDGKCNQQSRSQSPSFNMCHQSNLEMKPMMHANIQFHHNQQQQDTNITYRHPIKSNESPMMKEDNFENLTLDELPMYNNSQAQPEFKPQISTNSNPNNSSNMEKLPKMNGISNDNSMKYHQQQPQQYQNDLANNQMSIASQPQTFQNQRQQLPPVQQIQQNQAFHTSTPHLISNITSDTRNVYHQHVQRPEPTAYPSMSSVSIASNEKTFGATNHPTAQQVQQAKDISLKSLSGLESLVDQISNANPEQETAAPPPMPAAPTPSYPTPSYGSQHYFHPSHPQNQPFPSPFPIGSFPNPSYSSFTNYHQNLMNQSPHHVGMPNPVYPNSGYPPHPSQLIPYGNSYPAGSFNPQGSSNYYNSMFDRLNF